MNPVTIAQALRRPDTLSAPEDTLLHLQSKAHDWRWMPYDPAIASWKDELLHYLAAWLGPIIREEVREGPSYAHPQGQHYRVRTWEPSYQHPWFTLAGRSRIGKTLLLSAAVRTLQRLNDGGQLKRPTGTGQRSLTIAHIQARDLTSYQEVQEYARYDLVYLEDMASGIDEGTAGDIARSRTKELLDARTMRPTLMCCNLSEASIAATLDKRIADRLTRDGGVHLVAEGVSRHY